MPSHVVLVLCPKLRTIFSWMYVHDGGGGNCGVTAVAAAGGSGCRIRKAGWGRQLGLGWLSCVVLPGGRAIPADAGGPKCALTHGLCVRMIVEALSE